MITYTNKTDKIVPLNKYQASIHKEANLDNSKLNAQ